MADKDTRNANYISALKNRGQIVTDRNGADDHIDPRSGSRFSYDQSRISSNPNDPNRYSGQQLAALRSRGAISPQEYAMHMQARQNQPSNEQVQAMVENQAREAQNIAHRRSVADQERSLGNSAWADYLAGKGPIPSREELNRIAASQQAPTFRTEAPVQLPPTPNSQPQAAPATIPASTQPQAAPSAPTNLPTQPAAPQQQSNPVQINPTLNLTEHRVKSPGVRGGFVTEHRDNSGNAVTPSFLTPYKSPVSGRGNNYITKYKDNTGNTVDPSNIGFVGSGDFRKAYSTIPSSPGASAPATNIAQKPLTPLKPTSQFGRNQLSRPIINPVPPPILPISDMLAKKSELSVLSEIREDLLAMQKQLGKQASLSKEQIHHITSSVDHLEKAAQAEAEKIWNGFSSTMKSEGANEDFMEGFKKEASGWANFNNSTYTPYQAPQQDWRDLPEDRHRIIPMLNNKWTGALGGMMLSSVLANKMGLRGPLGWLAPVFGAMAGRKYFPNIINSFKDAPGTGIHKLKNESIEINNQRPLTAPVAQIPTPTGIVPPPSVPPPIGNMPSPGVVAPNMNP
jgi:hypothetical protein